MAERGMYAIFEGGDGVGKSTVMNLIADRNRSERGRKTYTIEEPDSLRDENGTALVLMSVELRRIIKTKAYGRSALTNELLFNASRRENLLQGIEPALAADIDVLGARNHRSTDAYQGHGQGQDLTEIKRRVLEATSKEYMEPDFTFVLDLEEEERLARIEKRDSKAALDTFESLDNGFHTLVANGYRIIAKSEGYPLISAAPPAEEVADEIWHFMFPSKTKTHIV